MDSSSASTFRFRDHQETTSQESTESEITSVASSVSSVGDGGLELESMTGKGIKHLCLELLELKKASDDDFHENIFSNYSAFVRIFEEVEVIETELMRLKQHVSTQRQLVKDLIDSIYLKVLLKDTTELIIEDPDFAESFPWGILEARIRDVSDTLDILLVERRFDEAIGIIETEVQSFQRIQLEENYPQDVLRAYDSAMSKWKAILADQLTMVAKNPRITAPELQKTLSGICRLGDCHLSTHLLLKYYHSRIATGIHDFQCSKVFLRGTYIRELAKFVFSMIYQAARSFLVLCGETSPYVSELVQWAREETKVFVSCFDKYVKSISEINGGLSAAVGAVQYTISFCSLLESQKIVLQPFLLKHICPSIEMVLQNHVDNFKKVIRIFTAADGWVLGRYLVSGILNEGSSSVIIGQQPEYCMLTNSGRKFVTLLQAVIEDITPLVTLQMDGSILKGIRELFSEYITILERAITSENQVVEKGSSRINLAESLSQQVSVIANLSTLVQIFSGIVRGISRQNNFLICEPLETYSISYQEKKLDSIMIFMQEASIRLQGIFFRNVIGRLLDLEDKLGLTPETYIDRPGDANLTHSIMPSVAFQVLFLELRKLEKLIEDNIVDVDWLRELLRQLMEEIFVWISNNEEMWIEEGSSVQHSEEFEQFLVDIQFLVGIAKYGGYFSNNIMKSASALISCLESGFVSAGLDPKRDEFNVEWATNAASEALRKLREIENTRSTPSEPLHNIEEEAEHNENQSREEDGVKISQERYSESDQAEDLVAADSSQVANYSELEGEDGFDDRNILTSAESPVVSGDIRAENQPKLAFEESQEVEEMELSSMPMGAVEKVSKTWDPTEEGTSHLKDYFESDSNKACR